MLNPLSVGSVKSSSEGLSVGSVQLDSNDFANSAGVLYFGVVLVLAVGTVVASVLGALGIAAVVEVEQDISLLERERRIEALEEVREDLREELERLKKPRD